MRKNGYLPIRDYALIGDCHGCALVGADGAIDWCAFSRFDADPVFCRLLDAERGGFWSIQPCGPARARRAYVDGTNILCTEFAAERGRMRVTDFMPVGRRAGAGAHDYVDLVAPHWLVRCVEILDGEVAFETRYRASREFARRPVWLSRGGACVRGESVPVLFGDVDWCVEDDQAVAVGRGTKGHRFHFVLAARQIDGEPPPARVDDYLRATGAFWREWLGYCRYRGPYGEKVRRSALALKAMVYAPSGALVAAPTTSLPEAIGGGRNWDYRFSWLRDSAFTLYALSTLGYSGEARSYMRYLLRCVRATLPEIRIMYGLEGESSLVEAELDHLAGYAGSRPVRTGNGAYCQRQIDVYGQILDLALLYETLGGRLDLQQRRLLEVFAAFVVKHWGEPDQGLWEARGPARDFVHGKLMCWVALDRAVRLFGARPEWLEARGTIAARILAEGTDPIGGHLGQSLQQPDRVDAAVLLAPALGFPLEAGALRATIEAVRARLAEGDLVHRYRGDDGLSGNEGAFLACSFWLVDALLAAGREDDARALFEQLLARANDVGLYAEEIDPASGHFLGNFPQAFTHLALVGSATNLELVRRHGAAALRGGYAERARRAVGATFGWRAIWAALRSNGRVGRLLPSRDSVLLWP